MKAQGSAGGGIDCGVVSDGSPASSRFIFLHVRAAVEESFASVMFSFQTFNSICWGGILQSMLVVSRLKSIIKLCTLKWIKTFKTYLLFPQKNKRISCYDWNRFPFAKIGYFILKKVIHSLDVPQLWVVSMATLTVWFLRSSGGWLLVGILFGATLWRRKIKMLLPAWLFILLQNVWARKIKKSIQTRTRHRWCLRLFFLGAGSWAAGPPPLWWNTAAPYSLWRLLCVQVYLRVWSHFPVSTGASNPSPCARLPCQNERCPRNALIG